MKRPRSSSGGARKVRRARSSQAPSARSSQALNAPGSQALGSQALSAPPAPLGRVRTLAGGAFEAFLDLHMLLAVRGCSRELRHAFSPERARALWGRVRPRLAAFGATPRLRPEAFALYRRTLRGPRESFLLNRIVCDRACRDNNLPVLQWLWPCPATSTLYDWAALSELFDIACKVGRAEVVEWLTWRFPLFRYTSPTAVTDLAAVGDTRLADYLLHNHAPGVDRGYHAGCCNLTYFADSIFSGNFDFAVWVLNRFPLDLSGRVERLLSDAAIQNPGAFRWLVEQYDIPWAELRASDDEILTELRPTFGDTYYGRNTDIYDWYLGRTAAERRGAG